MAIQIHDSHLRHASAADALRQAQFLVAALRRVVECFERRRRGAKHDRNVQALGADNGEIARRVTKAALLLVRSVVLLVDDDEPRRRQRRKHGRSRADDEPRLAAIGAPPRVEPLPLGDSRMQHGELFAEPFAQTAHELRGQADLGHEQQCLAARRQFRCDEPQVNLGLAAARYAVQQIAAESLARRLRRRDRSEDAALIGGELGLGPSGGLCARATRACSGGAAGSTQPLATSRSIVPAATSCVLSSPAVKARARSAASARDCCRCVRGSRARS